MNISCSAEPCPVILDCSCVFYSGANLIYTGIVTNDTLCNALIKIDNKFKDAAIGYVFQNGIIQVVPGGPVKLGGTLTQNTVITSGPYTFALTGTIESTAFITTGGTSLQFVKGDGSLDSTTYQPAGNYITALTGDGTASGPGSAVFTLSASGVIANTYGSSTQVPVITVDAKGRVTNITNTAISYPSQLLLFSGDVSGAGTTGANVTLTLATVNSNVYATNTFLKFAVNGKGLVTSATPIISSDIITALGYTPVPNTRTITINGVTQDLSVNRSWTIAAGTGTVTSVGVISGTGILASITNPTTTPVITITNTAPDQTVVLNNGTGISVTGTYPNFTINATSTGSVTAVTATSPLFSSGGATPNITIQQASGSQAGYLSSTDWTTFNSKQNPITLTTTGTSGAATFIANTLNIPQYSGGTSAGVNGLNGTTNIGLGGTLLNATTIDANGYDFYFNNINNYYLSRGDFGLKITQYNTVTIGEILANNQCNFTVDPSNLVIYSGNQGTISGLKLDFSNNTYELGDIPNGQGLEIYVNTRNYTLGDYLDTYNGTRIIVNDIQEKIFTQHGGQTKGLYLDFANNQYYIGDTNYFVKVDTSIPETTISTLSGTGTEMVVADASGVLSRQAIPSAGATRSVNVVSANTAAGSTSGTDYVYLVSGTTTITLPTPVGNTNLYTIKRVGTGVVSIATTSGTIDGSASPITINVQYVSLDLISDGTNWNII